MLVQNVRGNGLVQALTLPLLDMGYVNIKTPFYANQNKIVLNRIILLDYNSLKIRILFCVSEALVVFS